MSPRSRADSAGAVPERRDVYERLADELRQGIVSGRYKPGDRLPSTLELMERTGVANLTVRGAYRVLVEEGLVESVSKRGFYVRRPNAMTWRMNPAKRGRRRAPDISGPVGRRRRGCRAGASGRHQRRDRGSSALVLGTAGRGAARAGGELAGAGPPRCPLRRSCSGEMLRSSADSPGR